MSACAKVLVFTLAAALVSLTGWAQATSTNVLDWKAATTLNSYLVQQLHQTYTPRAARLARAMQSAAGAAAYRDSVRARFQRVLGPLPARTPLHAQMTGQLARPDFRIEKIIFESTPNHHVTANLYVPAGAGPWPGVLLPCGHEAEAKATVSYQQTAILFALNGFAVLVPDPISQGERMQLTDAAGKSRTRGGTTEHTLLNAQAALVGYTLPAAELWDNVRGLDYLASRPEVDTARLGCLGNSGGATQTAYLMALDPRLKVAALCSYVAAGERNLELTGPADGCVMLPGAGRAELDLADWPIMFAPKPLLTLAGRYDFVDYNSIATAQTETGGIYRALGKPEQTHLFTYDDGHGISRPKRAAAVRWFRQWLGNTAQAEVTAGRLPVSTVRELQCTATGQVNTSFPDEENLTMFYQAEAQRLAVARPALTPNAVSSMVEQQLGRAPLMAKPLVEVAHGDTVRQSGLTFQKLLLRYPDGPPLPVLLLNPPGTARPNRVMLWFSDRGKSSLADSASRLRTLLASRTAVLLVDLRGQGETADPTAALDPKYYNREYRPALIGLHLGKPLLTQRVEDMMTVLHYVFFEPAFRGVPVEVMAEGQTSALVALHVAVGRQQIIRVRLRALPASYQSQLAQPTARDGYSDVLPGVLRHYDVPDLVRALGKRLVM